METYGEVREKTTERSKTPTTTQTIQQKRTKDNSDFCRDFTTKNNPVSMARYYGKMFSGYAITLQKIYRNQRHNEQALNSHTH